MTASRITNQKEVTVAEADLAETVVAEDLVDAEPEDMAETHVVAEDLEETDLQEKCTRQPVQNVEQNVKFHSNQVEKNQFIVTTVSKSVNQQETIVEDISHF